MTGKHHDTGVRDVSPCEHCLRSFSALCLSSASVMPLLGTLLAWIPNDVSGYSMEIEDVPGWSCGIICSTKHGLIPHGLVVHGFILRL